MGLHLIRSQQLLAGSTLITDDDKEWEVAHVTKTEEKITALFSTGEEGTFPWGEKLTVRPRSRQRP